LRAYHETVWFLRGLAIWLFLSVLSGLASTFVLLNHETADCYLEVRYPALHD